MTFDEVTEQLNKIAGAMSVRHDQIDDFVQEGLIAAHRAYNRYKKGKRGEELTKLVLCSARNAMRSWQRRLIRMERAVSLDAVQLAEPNHTETSAVAVLDTMHQTIRDLEPLDQEVALAWMDRPGQKTMQQVAEEVGCSRATVSRCLSRFRDEFTARWYPEEEQQAA